jgi:hypothetical protein
VSKKLEDRGLVKAAGVLAEPINESDHRPVMLDIDFFMYDKIYSIKV